MSTLDDLINMRSDTIRLLFFIKNNIQYSSSTHSVVLSALCVCTRKTMFLTAFETVVCVHCALYCMYCM
jgi:hypothetical protein